MVNKAVYAGSFDPLTNGHLWMIEKGAGLFDELVVVIGENPQKEGKGRFSIEERLEMLEKAVRDMPHVSADYCENKYLGDYATSIKANYLLRGIRSHEDLENETEIKNFNQKHYSDITTNFLMPPHELASISSSYVCGLVGYQGWEKKVEELVPSHVYDMLIKKNRKV